MHTNLICGRGVTGGSEWRARKIKSDHSKKSREDTAMQCSALQFSDMQSTCLNLYGIWICVQLPPHIFGHIFRTALAEVRVRNCNVCQ